MKSGREKTMSPETDAFDRILAGEEPLVPSSGFLGAVMDRVRDEALAPPPLPFPWKRALPGIVLAAGVLSWGGFELIRFARTAWAGWSLTTAPHLTADVHLLQSAAWVAAALAVSLLTWICARRLAERGSFL